MGLERHEGENFCFWVNYPYNPVSDPVIIQIMIDVEEEINLTLMSW